MSAAPADGPSPAKVAKRQDEEQQKKLHELVYFDIAGKGEPIRLAFTYAGIPFVDTRMQGDDWPRLKPKTKFGQVPLVRTPSGSELFQSASILRYIGRIAPGDMLYPTSDVETCALIDSVIDTDTDVGVSVVMHNYGHRFGYQHLSAEVQAEAAKHIIEEVFPLRLTQFERLLEQSPTNWIAGTQGPSIADFVLALHLKGLEEGSELRDQNKARLAGIVSKGFPRLTQLLKDFFAVPAIAAYYARSAASNGEVTATK
eukprot:INCI10262.1.p1 GENE.INCI10262.1~~INCI10262.1.p1  ORF type:complete len:289 (-),score=46.40 INCI10262.1:82-852(-)